MNAPILVFIEHNNKKVADVSLELISEATRLAKKLHCEIHGVVLSHNAAEELSQLGHYGCQKLYYVKDKRLNHFSSVPYAKLVTSIIKKHQPQIVLFGATSTGRDIAPRVASELCYGLTADCTKLEIGSHSIKDQTFDNTLLQIRPAFGGNIVATIVSPESNPSMATVREGVMKLNNPETNKKVEIIDEPCDLSEGDFLSEILEVIREEKTVDLKQARIIVASGMGASTPECISLIKQLAKTLGGEVGASRPVVDAGLLGKDHQVGQTGITVRPNLYIACGISGQIQHMAGMSEAKRIIAINNDPDAPIFKIANYGIVGDVKDVIPKMIKAYRG